jgi:hypothetical protein
MFKFDLRNGYYHVNVHGNFQKILAISWEIDEKKTKTFFVYTVIAFGLSSAPYLFTKLLRP